MFELQHILVNNTHIAELVADKLEQNANKTNEMKVRFEKERELFGNQLDVSEECFSWNSSLVQTMIHVCLRKIRSSFVIN